MTSDAEDWLYRRGAHAGDDAGVPDDSLPPPTPVCTYGVAGEWTPPVQPPVHEPATPPPSTPPPAPTRRRARRRPARVVRRIAVILLVVAVYLVGIPLVTWSQVTRADATPAGKRPAEQPGTLFVLAGSDSREGLTGDEQQQLGTGSDAGRRSDTLMLLYVPPSGKAALVSLPRDSWVSIPGHGKNKINAAYSFGGPTLLVQTVEQNTGLRVDGYAEIGFGGFAAMVDAVGGIELCPKEAIKDRDSNLDIPAGCQRFDGATALGYVRMRKADPLGDLGRVQRQREVLGVLAKQVVSPLTVVLPWRYWGVNSAGARAMTLGSDTGLPQMAGLASGVAKVATGDGITLTVPVANADLTTSAGSAVAWDAASAKQLFGDLARGDTSNLTRFVR